MTAPEDWRDPAQALAVLYRHAEGTAIEAIDWYLSDKRYKKLCSRLLRALAIALVAAGGVVPLVSAAQPGGGGAGWGYVLLALAAACVGFDRFFGLSSGWMRDVTAAQAVQQRLERFQFDWTTACAQAAPAPVAPEEVLERLDLLRAFSEDVRDLVRGETGEWVAEFQSTLAQFDMANRYWHPTHTAAEHGADRLAASPDRTDRTGAGETHHPAPGQADPSPAGDR